MARNRSKLELVLQEGLETVGLSGWEHATPGVPGSPDLCLPGASPPIAVFVDGCFWHGCPLHYKEPRSRKLFWRRKILRNKIRDRGIGWLCRKCEETQGILAELGWIVVRVWEHEIREDLPQAVRRVLAEIRRQRATYGISGSSSKHWAFSDTAPSSSSGSRDPAYEDIRRQLSQTLKDSQGSSKDRNRTSSSE